MRLFIKGNITKLDDSSLILKYKETGDKYYVGELFKRYSHLVYGLCLGYFKDKDDSKDAVMKIFEKMFEELKKREVDNFKVWITFVSRNYCISELRKEKTRSSRENELSVDDEPEHYDPKEAALKKEAELEHLNEALDQLND